MKASLTPQDVAYIRKNISNTNLQEMMDRFSVSHQTIRNAAMGKLYYADSKDVDVPPLKKWVEQKTTRSGRINKPEREEIKRLRSNGESLRRVAQKFGISTSYVSRITNGDYDA